MKKKRLLIMEDNVDHLGMMKTYLELEGYEVEAACNGREGLDIIARYKPDLVVSDLQMPDMDGMEMVHQLKANPLTANIPIIIVTGAKTSPNNIVEGLVQGVDAYLPKPFELDELSFAIQELFKQRELEESPDLPQEN